MFDKVNFINIFKKEITTKLSSIIKNGSEKNIKSKKDELDQIKNKTIYSLILQAEPHFETIHDLLLWKNLDQSFGALIAFNIFYWFIVYISSHLLSAICFLVFLYKVQEFWSTVVWPEISLEQPILNETDENWTSVDPKILSAPEITRLIDYGFSYLKLNFLKLWDLRQKNHLLFFLINLTGFTSLFILGKILSGSLIIYFILMATLLAPGFNVHLLPILKLDNFIEDNLNEKMEKNKSNESNVLNENDLNESNLIKSILNPEFVNQETSILDQVIEKSKVFINQNLENISKDEFIRQKQIALDKVHNHLTEISLKQNPLFTNNNKDLVEGLKYLDNEYEKLNKIKEDIKLKTNNSIESNFVPTYFESESPKFLSDSEEEFEIIPSFSVYE